MNKFFPSEKENMGKICEKIMGNSQRKMQMFFLHIYLQVL
jgi:hypothetical protein